jgi:cyclopropane-fatty-acyl-phospholipid synthase
MKRGLIRLAESGLIPDEIIRRGIGLLNRKRLRREESGSAESRQEKKLDFIEALRWSPLVLQPEKPREQHYELPPAFFQQVLGRHLKYSCCLWTDSVQPLDEAEEAMLELTCRRAGIEDGMTILDAGCGWGALSLYIADRYPGCRVVAVSNSPPQRQFIEGRCRERRIASVEVRTADIDTFDPGQTFDRILSIEMFEHLRNYREILRRVSSWLNPEGRAFIHIFCHREYAYLYESEGEDDWMGQYFFTAGMMPSNDLLHYFQKDLILEKHWVVSGRHYQKTAEAWLRNLDRNRDKVLPILSAVYGSGNEKLWFQRWRIFFLACSELWGFKSGEEWWVGHYLFVQRK